ncbi:hypothetical protein PQR62_13370 [Herbaspirillum lusitanum]|uniref:Uncharacterized protein n=1 Tax=Herbaspirillum lusitanum TaxID=213312 RepID=A0ABW9AB88_9BURK
MSASHTKPQEKSADKKPVKYDTPSEVALDEANEMSFPNSDPVASSNITRIKKAPEMADAKHDHQNSHRAHAGTKSGSK